MNDTLKFYVGLATSVGLACLMAAGLNSMLEGNESRGTTVTRTAGKGSTEGTGADGAVDASATPATIPLNGFNKRWQADEFELGSHIVLSTSDMTGKYVSGSNDCVTDRDFGGKLCDHVDILSLKAGQDAILATVVSAEGASKNFQGGTFTLRWKAGHEKRIIEGVRPDGTPDLWCGPAANRQENILCGNS